MNKSRGIGALAAGIVSMVLVFAPGAGASSGFVDSAFGVNGVAIAAIGDSATAEAIAVQPDGDLVTVGFAKFGEVHELAVTRHHADGSLDRHFGTNGIVTTRVGTYPEAQAVAIQKDGKIVAAGKALADRSTLELVLARYNRDGSLDAEFGRDGVVEAQTGAFPVNAVVGIALDPDGKLLVAADVGPNGVNNFGVLRYNPDGSPDETFGTNGMAVTEMSTFAAVTSSECSAAIPSGLVLQPEGKVVVAGSAQLSANWRNTTPVTLVRYNADGSLDHSFGAGGILTTVLNGSDGAAVGRQSDGSLVVGGSGGSGFALARYHADGTLNTAFGAGGTATTPVGAYVTAPSGLVIEPDGKLIISGSSLVSTNARAIALARFEPDGSPDTSFGTNGVARTVTGQIWVPTGPNASHWTLICPFRCVSPVIRQHDGRLVVADGARNESQEQPPTFRLVRYADAPMPDSPGPPQSHQPATTTTTTGSTDGRGGNPPEVEPAGGVGATTSTMDPPAGTIATGHPSPRAARPSHFPISTAVPTTGIAAEPPTSIAPTSPMSGPSAPAPSGRDEQAAATTPAGNRPTWPIAAGAAAAASGSALVGWRRRSRRQRASH